MTNKRIEKWEELCDTIEDVAYKTEDYGQTLDHDDINLERLQQIKHELLEAWEHMCYMLTYEKNSL